MDILKTYQFVDQWVLWFLLIIPGLIVRYVFTYRFKQTTVKTSTYDQFTHSKSGFLPILKHLLFGLRIIAIGLFIVALARPQLKNEADSYTEHFNEGIDIIVSMDASSSMLAEDFEPNRFEASKNVAKEFIAERKNDRIGLVVFQAQSYTQCPLTSDNNIALELLEEMERDIVQDGTAIGMGLATAVNRLRESTAPSKVVILLTDGMNQHGKIHPLTAADMATEYGIRVYTIGIGTNGKARMPYQRNIFTGKMEYRMVPVEIDEEILQEIANKTGGKYFRATDNDKLKSIYEEIDQLEKEKIKSIEYEVDLPEKNILLLLIGFSLVLVEFIVKSTVLKSIP